jgi:hypothetical protein
MQRLRAPGQHELAPSLSNPTLVGTVGFNWPTGAFCCSRSWGWKSSLAGREADNRPIFSRE